MINQYDPKLIASVVQHEGYRAFPYRCTSGALTIGWGHNLDERGITEDAARLLLHADLESAILFSMTLHGWKRCNEARQRVLAEMVFQMGYEGVCRFKLMLAAIYAEDWQGAHDEMLDSKWAKHDSPARARTLAKRMLEG